MSWNKKHRLLENSLGTKGMCENLSLVMSVLFYTQIYIFMLHLVRECLQVSIGY